MDNQNNTSQPDDHGHGDYKTIAQFISDSSTALTNAQGDDILPLMEDGGYTKDDIQAKQEELGTLTTLNEAQLQEYGEQYEATENYKKAKAAAHKTYIDHIELARIAFKKDIGARTALGLRGDRAQSQSGYAAQGLLFYNNALASTAYGAALAKKGIKNQHLQDGKAAFQNLQTLSSAQQKETGEAQGATKKRDTLYDELAEWMSDFIATAKIKLRDKPQWMEQLGIKQA